MMFLTTLNIIAEYLNTPIEELPFHLSTSSFDYPFSFFFEEDESNLIIYVTQPDGSEKLTIVPKKEICSVSIVYADEVKELFGDDGFKEKNSVSLYE